MTRDELLAKLTEIGTTEDAAARRALLTEVTDNVNAVYDSNDSLTAANTKFETDNKKLQEYNMQLFLKVGGQKQPPAAGAGAEPPAENNLTYDKLFNEKGELI